MQRSLRSSALVRRVGTFQISDEWFGERVFRKRGALASNEHEHLVIHLEMAEVIAISDRSAAVVHSKEGIE
jgi:hypothetical protein